MKKGTIFEITCGETDPVFFSSSAYSAIKRVVVLRALRDFDFDAVFVQWYTTDAFDPRPLHNADPRRFAQALLDNDFVEKVAFPSMWLGYNGFVAPNPERRSGDKESKQWVACCFDHTDCDEHPEIGVLCARGEAVTREVCDGDNTNRSAALEALANGGAK